MSQPSNSNLITKQQLYEIWFEYLNKFHTLTSTSILKGDCDVHLFRYSLKELQKEANTTDEAQEAIILAQKNFLFLSDCLIQFQVQINDFCSIYDCGANYHNKWLCVSNLKYCLPCLLRKSLAIMFRLVFILCLLDRKRTILSQIYPKLLHVLFHIDKRYTQIASDMLFSFIKYISKMHIQPETGQVDVDKFPAEIYLYLDYNNKYMNESFVQLSNMFHVQYVLQDGSDENISNVLAFNKEYTTYQTGFYDSLSITFLLYHALSHKYLEIWPKMFRLNCIVSKSESEHTRCRQYLRYISYQSICHFRVYTSQNNYSPYTHLSLLVKFGPNYQKEKLFISSLFFLVSSYQKNPYILQHYFKKINQNRIEYHYEHACELLYEAKERLYQKYQQDISNLRGTKSYKITDLEPFIAFKFTMTYKTEPTPHVQEKTEYVIKDIFLPIDRTHIISSMIRAFASHDSKDLVGKSNFELQSAEENNVIDAGGVKNEMIRLFFEHILKPETGLFTWNEDTNTYSPNPTVTTLPSTTKQKIWNLFYQIGRIYGYCIMNHMVIFFPLHPSIVFLLVNKQYRKYQENDSEKQCQQWFPTQYANLQKLKAMPNEELLQCDIWNICSRIQIEKVNEQALDFILQQEPHILKNDMDGYKQHNKNIDWPSLSIETAYKDTNMSLMMDKEVSESSLYTEGIVSQHRLESYLCEWIKQMTDPQYNESLYAFLMGVWNMVPDILLSIFTPDQFYNLFCGEKKIDFPFLLERSVTFYHASSLNIDEYVLTVDDAYIQEVKDVLCHQLTAEQQTALYQFITGKNCVLMDKSQIELMPKIKIIILTNKDDQTLPYAYTCSNRFMIPRYSSKEVIKNKILQSLEYLNCFGSE